MKEDDDRSQQFHKIIIIILFFRNIILFLKFFLFLPCEEINPPPLEIFRYERASQNKPLKMQYVHKREETNNNKESKEIIITKKINKNKK